jgi:hypothetical protein
MPTRPTAAPISIVSSTICQPINGASSSSRFIEQRSIRDIAGRLNRTEGAVKQLQFRALLSLRTRMEGANG